MQQVVAVTTLPHGTDADTYRLSTLFTIRIFVDNPHITTLQGFSDVLNWPAVANSFDFICEFARSASPDASGKSFSVVRGPRRLTPANPLPHPDWINPANGPVVAWPDLWNAMFTKSTKLASAPGNPIDTSPPPNDTMARGYAVTDTLKAVVDAYGYYATARVRPALPFVAAHLPDGSVRASNKGVAVPDKPKGVSAERFRSANGFRKRSSSPAASAIGHGIGAQDDPTALQNDIGDVECHKLLSSLLSYPFAMRQANLLIDWAIDRATIEQLLGLPLDDYDRVRMFPVWNVTGPYPAQRVLLAPFTSIVHNKKIFCARQPPGLSLSLDENGFFDIGAASNCIVEQLDPLADAARFTKELEAEEKPGLWYGAQPQTLSNLRSSSLVLFKPDNDDHVIRQIECAQNLLANHTRLRHEPGVPSGNTIRPLTPPIAADVTADQLRAGFRADVRDIGKVTSELAPAPGGQGPWRSLCVRRVRYDLRNAPGATANSYADGPTDEGWIRPTVLLNQGAKPQPVAGHPQNTNSTPVLITPHVLSWAGWGLSAQRFGIGLDPIVDINRDAALQPAELPFAVSALGAPDGKLQVLRFGHMYQFRLRDVDISGFGPRLSDRPSAGDKSLSGVYIFGRLEPLPPPMVLYGHSNTAMLCDQEQSSDAESIMILRNRSAIPESPASTASVKSVGRYMIPPRVSIDVAERHGVIDKDNRPDRDLYDKLAAADHWDGTTLLRYDQNFTYVPDPLAEGVRITIPAHDPANPAQPSTSRDIWFTKRDWWRKPQAIVIRVDASPADSKTWIDIKIVDNEFRVSVPPAFDSILFVQSIYSESRLPEVALWTRFSKEFPFSQDRGAFKASLLSGGDGSISLARPAAQLRVVHATQFPLDAPRPNPPKSGLIQPRSIGETFVKLQGVIGTDARPIPYASADKLEIIADWADWDTDATAVPDAAPISRTHQAIVATLEIKGVPWGSLPPAPIGTVSSGADPHQGHASMPLDGSQWTRTIDLAKAYLSRGDGASTSAVVQDFGDHKARRVMYRFRYTSRFRAMFSTENGDKGAQVPVTRDSEPISNVLVEATAPPAPVTVLEAVPLLADQDVLTRFGGTYTRSGGAIRVFLASSWFSSGIDEQVGVVFARQGSKNPDGTFSSIEHWQDPNDPGGAGVRVDKRDEFVSDLGADPTLAASTTPEPVVVRTGNRYHVQGLTLPLQSGDLMPQNRDGFRLIRNRSADDDVNADDLGRCYVVPHRPAFDPNRRLWYCDIQIRELDESTGSSREIQAYMPIFQLSLVRYQPNAIAGCKISPVGNSQIVMLTPDRTVTMTFGIGGPLRVQRISIVVSTNVLPEVLDQGSHRGTAVVAELRRASMPDIVSNPKDQENQVIPIPLTFNGSHSWIGTFDGSASREWFDAPAVYEPFTLADFDLVVREYEEIDMDYSISPDLEHFSTSSDPAIATARDARGSTVPRVRRLIYARRISLAAALAGQSR